MSNNVTENKLVEYILDHMKGKYSFGESIPATPDTATSLAKSIHDRIEEDYTEDDKLELPWMDSNIILPKKKDKGREFYVTCYNDKWVHKKQTMIMIWDREITRVGEQYIWRLQNKQKLISTWKVTHWMEKPKPAE